MKFSLFCWLSFLSTSIAFAPVTLKYGKRLFSKIRAAEEKLIFDTKEGRFFEADIAKLCEEEFCLVDGDTGKPILLTKDEKERIFLDCIQSYYATGKNVLPDDQFDRLKEDLSWEGSALVTLSRNETLFMNAVQSWSKGKAILSDKEFDDLKISLRESGSKIAAAEPPQCYTETGVCKVTWTKDQLKTSSLYVPATFALLLVVLALDVEIPLLGSINPLIQIALAAYPISTISKQVTENFLFKDPLVAKGPCPKCGVENRLLFGDVLGVKGDEDESTVKCTNCKAELTVKRQTLRVSTLVGAKK